MKTKLSAAAIAALFVAYSLPAAAQSMDMPGMSMPVANKPAATKTDSQLPPDKSPAAVLADQQKAAATQEKPAAGTMDMPMEMGAHAGHHMRGALGPYAMQRESSGTAWQPDSSQHEGIHGEAAGFALMLHGSLALVADTQSGPRGDDKLFVGGHVMGAARRDFGTDTIQFRTILSPEPLMGKRGYPLLLASGETANGRDRLIDRQHPHDFIGELSVSWSHRFNGEDSLFVYAGLPGEPAFGPPAYLHREAIMDSPEAPITHHWLDSTHVTEGVVTAGLIHGRIKIEASRFNGREPDQHRWDIETGPLDSTAVRLSWNPVRTLALQASWTRLKDPEQLEPGIDQTRWSASALYAADIAPGWRVAATAAIGRRTQQGRSDDAAALEAALKHGHLTVFGRAEVTDNRELLPVADGPAYRVGKVSLGALRDFRIAEHLSLGMGGLVALNRVPAGLASAYGGRNPTGAMGFARLKLD